MPTHVAERSSSTPSHAQASGFTCSVVQNTAPGGLLCKVFSQSETDDSIESETDARLAQGSVRGVEFNSIRSFMDFRSNLESNQALMMGRAIYDDAVIVTQARLTAVRPDERHADRIIARDRAHISWSEGPSVVMLDLDRPDKFPLDVSALAPSSPHDWRKLLIDCVPALGTTQMAWAPSSSSHIWSGDEELQGLRGQRFYFVISSGVDTPVFKTALHDALVSRGLVWYEVSKSGSLLKRTPFDLSVYQPERLDFAAGPKCVSPLEWRPGEPTIWNPDGDYLEASTILLTSAPDRRRIENTLAQARQARAGDAESVRERWIKDTGRDIALRQSLEADVGQDVARTAVERGVLLGGFVLVDSEGQHVTVSELLGSPASNHGRRFRDPLDPTYRNDSRIAVFLAKESGPARIFSHAHGGQSFRCQENLAVIRIGLIDQTVDGIRRALETDSADLYRHGNSMVAINEVDAKIQPLTDDGVALRIHRRFGVLGRNKDGDWVPRNLPPRDLKALRSETASLPIPALTGVGRGPYAHADGTIVDEPGYDPVSQAVYVSASESPPRVRRNVTVPEAEEVLRSLWLPFSHFPFKSGLDRGIVLSALITAVVRPSLSIAPGYIFVAHTAGTGKTLLAQAIGALQTGIHTPAAAFPGSEDEIRKQVFATVRVGRTYLLYDNAERGSQIDSAVLASLITSPTIEGRVLGESTVESPPNRLTLALTGNNIQLRGDLNRRILTVTLDAGVERPWEREFEFDPVRYVLAHWLPLRIAALELIQAWHAAGSPLVAGVTGFPEWDGCVRSVVAWISDSLDIGVDFADPAAAFKAAYEEDPESDTLGELLTAWFAIFGEKSVQMKDVDAVLVRVRASDVKALIDGGTGCEDGDIDSTFADAHRAVLEPTRYGTSESAAFGQYLARHAGRVVRGLRLAKQGKSGGSRRWRVEEVLVREASHVPR